MERPARSSGPERPPRRAAFVVWVLVATWAILEGVLRVGAALLGPGAPVAAGVEIEDGALRVLALGDSWVAGAEAPQGQGFVDAMERELAAALAPRQVVVRNLGLPGANTAHVARVALTELPTFQPHILVLLVGVNNGTSFAEVAEFDHEAGYSSEGRSLLDGLRTLKAARLVWASLRGSAWDRPMPERIARRAWPSVTMPVAPEFLAPPGNAYFHRRTGRAPAPSGSLLADRAWALLYASEQRELVQADQLSDQLAAAHGWDDERGVAAPTARLFEEILGRYALLRHAREREDWRAVRRHGGALHDVPARTVLSDAGAAEAALLAGNWRLAAQYLEDSWRRAPGFPDLLDLASRFPPPARTAFIEEVLEAQPTRSSALDRARHIDGWRHPEEAATWRSAWLERHPNDRAVRAELALWILGHEGWTPSDRLMGLEDDWDKLGLPPPTSDDPADWRYYVHRAREAGGEDRMRDAWKAAMARFPDDAGVLFAVASLQASMGECGKAQRTAARYFEQRGDPQGVLDALGECLPQEKAIGRVDDWLAGWRPLAAGAGWMTAYGASRDPEVLFRRHLAAVLTAAEASNTQVLLLDYPNPRHEYMEFQEQFGTYAEVVGVPFLDLFGQFADSFDAEEWAALIAPGGHCNAEGYAQMGARVAERLLDDPLFAGAIAAGAAP